MILVPVKAVAKVVAPMISLLTREVETCTGDPDPADKERIGRLDADGGKVI